MMTRIFKSRIYYVLGYNNRVKRIPSILLGISIPFLTRLVPSAETGIPGSGGGTTPVVEGPNPRK
jgi:hypothetical protein